jgi:hypothetical protein
MILDAFEEVLDRIKSAKSGLVAPSIIFKNQLTDKHLSLNSKMRLGMGTLMLVTGPPNSGKTALVDSQFILNPILDNLAWGDKYPPIYCVYRSMERPIYQKLAKWIAYMLYIVSDGKILIDNATLFGYNNKKRPLTDDDIDMILDLKGQIAEIGKSLDIVGDSGTPEDLKQYMLRTLYRLGSYITTDLDSVYVNGKKIEKKFDLTDEFGRPYAMLRWPKTGKEIKVYSGYNRYFAHDPKMIIINVNDTVDRIKTPPKYSVNEVVAEHSNNMAEMRKHEAICGIDIKQFSKESEKEFRTKGNALSVGLSDIKGASEPAQNSDIALSILDPGYFQLREWGGHPDGMWNPIDVERFHGAMRLLQVFKNTDGANLFKMPVLMLGEIGFFAEIPSPDKITEQDYKDLNAKYLQHLDPRIDRSDRQGFLLDTPKDMLIKNPNRNRESKAPF